MGRNLAAIVGVAILILSGVVGCGKADRVMLDRADSLLSADSADSALRILDAIDPDDLWGSEQRAYYALLKTQAHYKCYLPIESDSLIFSAKLYFKESNLNLYGLCSYYLGAIYEAKGFVGMAMDEYKEAELHLRTPLKYRALLLQNLGSLYIDQYLSEMSLPILEEAEQICLEISDSSNLCYVYGLLGKASTASNRLDSAFQYYQKSMNLAADMGDTAQVIGLSNGLALQYLMRSDDQMAKKVIYECIDAFNLSRPDNTQCLHLAEIAIRENELDSALMFLDLIVEPNLIVDFRRSQIYELNRQFKKAINYRENYYVKLDSIWNHREKMRVDEIAARYDNTRHITEKNELAFWQKVWASIAILVIIVLFFVAYLLYYRQKQYIKTKLDLLEALRYQKDSSAFVELINARQLKMREAIAKRLALFGELISLSYEYRGNGSLFIKKFDELLARDPLSSDAYNDILDIVNSTYYGLIDHLRSHYSTISEKELLICALTCVGYSSQQLFVILGAKNIETIYNQKYRIGVKFGMKGDLKLSLDKIVERLQNRQ